MELTDKTKHFMGVASAVKIESNPIIGANEYIDRQTHQAADGAIWDEPISSRASADQGRLDSLLLQSLLCWPAERLNESRGG